MNATFDLLPTLPNLVPKQRTMPVMAAETGLADVFTSFPTVVFTVVFGFCLAWWILTIIIAGLDADVDVDADTDFFGFGIVPFPLALTILSAGGLIVSLLAHAALRSDDSVRLAGGVGVGVLAGSLVGGLVLLKLLAKPLGKIFVEEPAPSRTTGVGSVCKVRTLTVSATFGDAEVITGPIRGAIIRVRAKDDRFARGDLALVVDFDEHANTYVIDDLPPELRPDSP